MKTSKKLSPGKRSVFNLSTIILLILTSIMLTLAIPTRVESQDEESIYVVRDDKGEATLTISMKNGEITIKYRSKKAGPNVSIRWKTIGLTLTRDPITTRAEAKNYTGHGPVRDAGSSGITYMYFEQAAKKETYEVEGQMHTTLTFSVEQVEAALKDDFTNIKKGTKIYLHGIFCSYERELVNGKDVDTIRKNDIKNWADIMNAEWWTQGTLEGFYKLFNMEISFMPKLEENTLYYLTEDGSFIAPKKNLESKYIDEDVSWTNEASSLIYYNSNYKLIGYYVISKIDKTKTWIDEGFLAGGKTINQIKSGKTKVLLGGMEIYLVYIKNNNNEPPPDIDPHVPLEEEIISDIEKPFVKGEIKADPINVEYFDVRKGVPTTESLYTKVDAPSYLLAYHLEKKVGTETFPVKVRKEYVLSWYEKTETGEIPKTETKLVEEVINIKRAYGYWEIISFDLFSLKTASIFNTAIANGNSAMVADERLLDIPMVNIEHSSKKEEHIFLVEEFAKEITIKKQIIYGDNTKPKVPREDFGPYVNEIMPELKVKNDSLIINGVEVISDDLNDIEGSAVNENYLSHIKEEGERLSLEPILYNDNLIIKAEVKNGNHHSRGDINYTRVMGQNSKYDRDLSYSISNINSLVIHTPVVCNPIYSSDNNEYVQKDDLSPGLNLVLDDNKLANDFTLKISNYGFHSSKKGYKERDYSASLRDESVSYLAKEDGKIRNEVKFPFDVYEYDGNERKTLLKKDTWLILGKEEKEFSLPIWVNEGSYRVLCRTVAVNADLSQLERISEKNANSNLINYVATSEFDVEVTGKLYGLTIYDITDYPMWEEVFRMDSSLELKDNYLSQFHDGTKSLDYEKLGRYNYTVGTKDQHGRKTGRLEKYTFPLINGSHPQYKNQGILKTGYGVRFKLTTTGNMYGADSSIIITPSFFYVDREGKNRQEIDLYYQETIAGINRRLVKVGSALDCVNIKYQRIGSPYTAIAKEELINTANLLEVNYYDLINRREGLFNFSHIKMSSAFRTFPNMDSKYTQNWYGYYYLPSKIYASPKGFALSDYGQKHGISFHEDFWLEDGYIIVNFNIKAIDSEGTEKLSYTNKGNNRGELNRSMWSKEGWVSKKKNSDGIEFEFQEGDFLIYNLSSSIYEDYMMDGLY